MSLLRKRRGCKKIGPVVESFILQKCDGLSVSKMEIRIMLNWRDIVGNGIAELAKPERVVFSGSNSGVLYLLVKNGGHATFIQYAIPSIMERIAVYFGFKVVSAIKVRQ